MSEESGWIGLGVAAAMGKEYAEEGSGFVVTLARLLVNAIPGLAQPIIKGGFLARKEVVGVQVTLGDHRYNLQTSRQGTLVASCTHVVRGVDLKTEEISVERWIEDVGDGVEQYARNNKLAMAALAKMIEG